ncbi:MFS transporter [Pigmentiphaga sp. H8]|uniref:MFS transporter n=1 Tax=Pigmentiphaga sp. H8 TaxID=2488560 RepID=UPI000F5999FD|nr:MFS transporter [Pigmentiphaga sp. H8]AZG08722.1 MFS transporter [Pigmentiphaga sp. H8]
MARTYAHDTAYEWKAVTILALGFGLMGLDRWLLAPMFPFMMKDLDLSYQDLGLLIGVLSLAWGVFSITMGRVSDRVGRRKVLIPAAIAFSCLSGLSGLATGLISLMLIRTVMGVAEGSFCPASVAAAGEASHPRRRGLNQGLQQSAFPLFGLGLAPIIATQLMDVLPSWHYVFFLSAVPGLILAWFMYKVIREPGKGVQAGLPAAPAAGATLSWKELLRRRNLLLAVGSILCAMTGIFVVGAMVPNYLTDYLKLTPQQMGLVVSAIGIGGFFGEFAVPGISDFIGRRAAAFLAFIGAALALYAFIRTEASPWALFGVLLVVSFFCFGLLALMTGPIATEAAPPGMVASAIGTVSGLGEIFGGGVAPVVAGYIAQHHGIQYTLYLALGGIALGTVVSLFLKETAPRKVEAGAQAQAS